MGKSMTARLRSGNCCASLPVRTKTILWFLILTLSEPALGLGWLMPERLWNEIKATAKSSRIDTLQSGRHDSLI
jgi:hypothetical protein